MDEVKRIAILSQISDFKFRITEIDEMLAEKRISKDAYEAELKKIYKEVDLLEEVIKYNELPKNYMKAPSILEVDIADYLFEHIMETNKMEHDGTTSVIEIQSRRLEEKGIQDMLDFIHSNAKKEEE